MNITYFTIDSFQRLFGKVEHAIKGNFHAIDPISVYKDRHLFFEMTGFDKLKKMCDLELGCILRGEFTNLEEAKQSTGKKKVYGASTSNAPTEKHNNQVTCIMSKNKIVANGRFVEARNGHSEHNGYPYIKLLGLSKHKMN